MKRYKEGGHHEKDGSLTHSESVSSMKIDKIFKDFGDFYVIFGGLAC